jgi:hypothetical protein
VKYAVEIVSGAVIYIRSFIKSDSGIQKLIRGIHRQHGDLISLLLFFFQNKEKDLKMKEVNPSERTRRHIPGDRNIHHGENLEFHEIAN